MKIYIYEGEGVCIGSCIIVISDSLKNAKTLIRKSLDKMGLNNKNKEISITDITEKEISNNTIIYEADGDY